MGKGGLASFGTKFAIVLFLKGKGGLPSFGTKFAIVLSFSWYKKVVLLAF